MKFTQEDLWETIQTLGWDTNDDIHIEIAGTSVYAIDGAGTKWAPKKGTRKYSKDAFIVIKNRSRETFAPSINDDSERLAHHLKSKLETVRESVDSEESTGQHSGTP